MIKMQQVTNIATTYIMNKTKISKTNVDKKDNHQIQSLINQPLKTKKTKDLQQKEHVGLIYALEFQSYY